MNIEVRQTQSTINKHLDTRSLVLLYTSVKPASKFCSKDTGSFLLKMPSNSPTIISAFEFPPPNESQLQPIVGGMQDKEKGKSKGRRSVSSAPSVRSSSKTNGSSLTHKRLRRVKSAVDDGRLLTLSSSDTPWGNKEWGKSQYTSDYVPKRPSSPIKIRPASATRMHNPHPNDVRICTLLPLRIMLTWLLSCALFRCF